MDKNTLFAGWSSVNITPDKKVSLQGQYEERISQGVHDSLWATALALETRDAGGRPVEQAVMVSCDLVAIQKSITDALRERVRGRVEGLDPDKIVLFATHIHTGPCDSDDCFELLHWHGWKNCSQDEYMRPQEYFRFLLDCLERVVVEAWRSRTPSKAAMALGHAVVGHNRLAEFDDAMQMYGSAESANFTGIGGPSDHGVELMYFWDMQDQLTGVIVNVACPAQLVEGVSVISADYIGAARKEIKQRFSPGVHVLPQIAAAGDQSPRDLVRRYKSETNTTNDFDGMEEVGARVADAVQKQYPAARARASSAMEFIHRVETVCLPLRKVTKGEAERAQKNHDALMEKFGSPAELSGWDHINYIDYKATMARKKIQDEAPLYKIEMHAIRLGEAAFITNPFELYLEYGLRIKARSKAKQTFTVQLCGAYGAYLPTRQAIRGGAYGAIISSTMVGPEGGDLLVEHAVAAVNQLWGDRGYLDDWFYGI